MLAALPRRIVPLRTCTRGYLRDRQLVTLFIRHLLLDEKGLLSCTAALPHTLPGSRRDSDYWAQVWYSVAYIQHGRHDVRQLFNRSPARKGHNLGFLQNELL